MICVLLVTCTLTVTSIMDNDKYVINTLCSCMDKMISVKMVKKTPRNCVQTCSGFWIHVRNIMSSYHHVLMSNKLLFISLVNNVSLCISPTQWMMFCITFVFIYYIFHLQFFEAIDKTYLLINNVFTSDPKWVNIC